VNRYVYSVVRFVPDPARGEFVNIAAVVGSDDTGEWDIQQVSNLRRAKAIDDHGTLPAVTSVIEEITGRIDVFLEATEVGEGVLPGSEPTEAWLATLHDSFQNIVQVTPPTPLICDSSEEAMTMVFDELLVDPERRHLPYVRRNTASKQLRVAYVATKRLRRDRDFFERVTLRSGQHVELLDFAVANGSVLQLAQAWSFQVPDQAEVARRVRAWGYTMRHLKDSGGRVQLEGRPLNVNRGVDLEVIYVPPSKVFGSDAFDDASAVFKEIGAQANPIDRADAVAARAVDLIEASK
jgi:hypothetical protein